MSAELTKPASHDHAVGGSAGRRDGYDLLTTLGSALLFDQQVATISHTESVEIIRQNFGFDLLKGITSVVLDPKEPHYYLEVRKKIP